MEAAVQYVKASVLKDKILEWGFGSSPYGEVLLVLCDDCLVGLFFVHQGRQAARDDMKTRFCQAQGFQHNIKKANSFLQKIKTKKPVPMMLAGTPFEHSVWRHLLKVPQGKTSTYGQLAKNIGNKKASRAVGAALNKNKIAWLVPCHRILAGNGALHGYRYGLEIKQKMLEQECAL
jgi:AraC family transcriptional regulator of adaptative response/methylated-DNA-[protein]-cysteine methyltransferase